jgi:hypothetical protein
LDPEDVAHEMQSCLVADAPAALEMIWESYAPDLLGYLTGLHCSRLDAEDTLQEVFVTIAKKRASVANARLLKPYLFQLACPSNRRGPFYYSDRLPRAGRTSFFSVMNPPQAAAA